ncbi:elongation factor Tu: mitochondrial-like protein 1 [Dinothrombium tinctorium]|uniref:protein-synthesizing GTPase n=1 Tax=Dinothrombium tinctorium TaxID=1965070 RepID=A0A3S3S3V6_9ACAR|nr:elongation factor Tu: mitochondrial-like protein 1 [Dinothrombium tinctorium]RWS10017.1 elongation factor Tu: mitochondrial-like protein 1 [Dinothrombium tinctorium]RWS10021.1 elongation factor Tu: mitochondrial-like protein 1 [Dinothrombium tinctorium]
MLRSLAKISQKLFFCERSTKANCDLWIRLLSEAKKKLNINVGTIGHVDHGKTSLTSAITKVCSQLYATRYVRFEEIDKAPEEQLRGVTINVAHIGYETKKYHYSHSDCPGHSDYIKNMICGTSQMDCAILVVAASEGEMPQTREHLVLSKQIGVNTIVVFVNKCDLIDKEVCELVELEIRELLNKIGFDGNNTPFVFGSALLALNGDQSEFGQPAIIKLLDTLDSHIKPPERDVKSPFFLPIENSVAITGRGTVAIGTVKRGVLKRGSPIEIIGHSTRLKSAASDIHMFKKSVPECYGGDHVGVLCRGLKVNQVRRGMVMVAPDSVTPNNRFEANLYLFKEEEGGRKRAISKRFVQQFFSETFSCGCRVDIPKESGSILMPGDHGIAHLTLARNMVMLKGQYFTIRELGKTIAAGIITNELPKVNIPHGVHLGDALLGYNEEEVMSAAKVQIIKKKYSR